MSIQPHDVVAIFEASLSSDYTRLRQIGAKVAQELDGVDQDAARKVRAILRRKSVPLQASGQIENLPVDLKSRLPLVEEHRWPSTPLFTEGSAVDTFSSFLMDVQHSHALAAKGIATKLALLLCGPPGTGKSLMAGHIAAQLGRPLYVVRLDAMVSSMLGDTAKNIRAVFDAVPSRGGVLFLDELDAVAKLRNDRHELGELKRVVNTVIQGLDSVDDQAVVIAATNHPELLDPAIWRRFPYKVTLDRPGSETRQAMWLHFLYDSVLPNEFPVDALARISEGMTGADIQNISFAARRNATLTNSEIDISNISKCLLETRGGRLSVPDRRPLTLEQKRKLSMSLVTDLGLNKSDAARLSNLTRQTVASQFKEEKLNGKQRRPSTTKSRSGAKKGTSINRGAGHVGRGEGRKK